MNRGFAAFLVVLVIGLVVVGVVSAGGAGNPSVVSLWLAAVVVVTTGWKFALADLFSTDGFDIEKTVADVALALSAALFSFALTLQFGPRQAPVALATDNLVFSAAVTFHHSLWPRSTDDPRHKAQQAMWLIAVMSVVGVVVTTWLAWRLRLARDKAVVLSDGRRLLYRTISVLLGAVTYATYFALTLYRA